MKGKRNIFPALCMFRFVVVNVAVNFRYDAILRDGLPDWRQPVYYYRRVRKMGFVEFLVFIIVIFTVGHFIIAWSVYLERKFELVSELLTCTPF